MNEVITPRSPVAERKCRIEELFDTDFIELLRLVPRNSLVRALVLKLTGKMPAPDCDTFEQLREWVEANCEKKTGPATTGSGRRTRDDGIAINVEFADTEYGRADYSVRRHGSGEFRIGAADLMEIVQEAIDAGGGLDEAVEVIAGKVDNDAWNECEPEMDDYGDYNYDEHDSNDTGDSETEFARRDIRNAVLDEFAPFRRARLRAGDINAWTRPFDSTAATRRTTPTGRRSSCSQMRRTRQPRRRSPRVT